MDGDATTRRMNEARAACDSADWRRARKLFDAVLAEEPDRADALDAAGEAALWLGDAREAVALRRRAYAAYRRSGDRRRAAATAVYLAAEERIAGHEAAANGWAARAARLLEGAGSSVERGWLELERSRQAAELVQAKRHAERAIALARELEDADLELDALAQVGYVLVLLGRAEEGMTVLDEAMAAVMAGETGDANVVGDTCCSMLLACEKVADHRRASEWSQQVVEYTRARNYLPLSILCETVFAGVLVRSGRWEEAERTLLASLSRHSEGNPRIRVPALIRLAELRVRQGRLEEVERLLEGLAGHPQAHPVLMQLELARGNVERAAAMAERCIGRAGRATAAGAEVVPVLVRVRIAQGDLESASAAIEELEETARQLGHETLTGLAELARAEIRTAAGDPGTAAAHLEVAIEIFGRTEMPLEQGRAHLLLGRLLTARGSDLAETEAKAAFSIFRRLGAARDADEAAAHLRSLGARGHSGRWSRGDLSDREREVLALLGEGLSNAGIAERLVIAPKTAGHHVSRILAKLELHNRTEAAAYAVRELPGQARPASE